jgi:hypothetical protein
MAKGHYQLRIRTVEVVLGVVQKIVKRSIVISPIITSKIRLK